MWIHNRRRYLSISAVVISLCVLTTILRPLLESAFNPSLPPPVLTNEHREEFSFIDIQLAELRGLPPNPNKSVNLFSQDELRIKLIDDMSLVYTPFNATGNAIVLWSLGLVEEDIDLIDIYSELYSAGIAGIYDEILDEILLPVQGEISAQEYLAYVHESMHAMQDLAFDLENGIGGPESCYNSEDTCFAIHSFIEGEATLIEALWLEEYSSPSFQEQLKNDDQEYSSEILALAPLFLQHDLAFPYTFGYKFVRNVFEDGGWEAVNGLYINPPLSTEQIIHFDRYPADHPRTVNIRSLDSYLSTSWEFFGEGVLGEWFTYLILAHGVDEKGRIPEDEARKAAEGWGGDQYQLYLPTTGMDVILVVQHLWDTPKDLKEFFNTLKKYATLRFGEAVLDQDDQVAWQTPNGYFAIYSYNDSTTWILAPDAEFANRIWARVIP